MLFQKIFRNTTMVRWRRFRLISSDCVDFGISYFVSDFIEKIIEDQDESAEPYISIPFDSSSVLEFVRGKEKMSAEVSEIGALLGVENGDVNDDIEIEKLVINNNNDVVSFRRASFCDNDVPPAECGSEIQINTASLESMVILTYEEELEECDIVEEEEEEEEISDMKEEEEEDAEDIDQEQEEGDICEESLDGNEDHNKSDNSSTGLSEEESIASDILDILISRVLDNCMIDMNLRALRIQALETLERKKLDQLRELELAKERKRLKRKQKKKARLERKQNDKKTEVDYRDKLQDEKTNIEGDLRYKLQEKSKRDLRTFLNRKK